MWSCKLSLYLVTRVWWLVLIFLWPPWSEFIGILGRHYNLIINGAKRVNWHKLIKRKQNYLLHCSSVLSPQLSYPSQRQCTEIHSPFPQRNSLAWQVSDYWIKMSKWNEQEKACVRIASINLLLCKARLGRLQINFEGAMLDTSNG